jgi:hypothetical protein
MPYQTNLQETPMYPRFVFLRTRYTLALLIAAFIALVAAGLAPRAALATVQPGPPNRTFTSGPFQMRDGERVTFGMLVPAVRDARSSAQFVILDSAGNQLASYPPDPGRAFFVSITYRANPASGQDGPSLEISHGIGNPDLDNGIGNPDFVPTGRDGILIGMLVPAVQRDGKTADPAFATMQSFNVSGGTMTHSFFVATVTPGPPS